MVGAAVVATALALVTAQGCGGSGGDSTQSSTPTTANSGDSNPSQPSPSKAQFIKGASKICIETKERSVIAYRKYSQENTIPSSGPGLAAKAADLVENVFAPIYDEQIEKIGALGAPPGDAQQVDAILASMRSGIEAAKRQPLSFIRSPAALDQASRLAVAYGLPACGNGRS